MALPENNRRSLSSTHLYRGQQLVWPVNTNFASSAHETVKHISPHPGVVCRNNLVSGFCVVTDSEDKYKQVNNISVQNFGSQLS